ncbi:MAG: hypothetical protein ACFFEK_06445 [Candidatus Thorarchaeota archaeon]
MPVPEDSRKRVDLLSNRLDRWLLRVGERIAKFLIDYRYLILVLLIGFIVWTIVFNVAVLDYVNSNNWNSRAAWLGPFPEPGVVQVFGYTIPYQLEGYSDYSFYYVHWGYNTLFGVLPYSPDYGVLELNGITNQNGAHMFPPFTSYLYAAGIALGNLMGWKNWGIGLLIVAFGYLTALPIYGITSELSSNKRVGEVAALTYLLNPLMLYHTDFLWFNPAPFVFFFFTGFYMLIRGKRHTGTLLIVCAALFKQTAWFLGVPLVVYLLVRPRERNEGNQPDSPEEIDKPEKSLYDRLISFFKPVADYFDLRNFMISVLVVLIFVGAVMLPYLIAQPHFLNYWSLALGSFSFEGNFVNPPPYNQPMRIQVLPIVAGMPVVAETLDTLILSGGPLAFAVILCAGVMILKDKYIGEEKLYFRRILYITLLMMLLVTLLGPRGVFKYYFVMLMPFFSIFSSGRMIRDKETHVPFSASMVWLPITFTLMILIPDRNIYLGYVLLIFIGYLFAPLLNKLYHYAKTPFRYMKQLIQQMTGITEKPLVADELLTDVSRKRSIANVIAQITVLSLGLFFIFFGGWMTRMAIGVDLVTGLEAILLFSSSFIVGFQLLSVAFSMSLGSKLRVTYLNRNLHEFSLVTVVLILIFGIWTYLLSWPVDLLSERLLLVLSSVFTSIWAISLLVNQRNVTRILTDILVLAGLSASILVWMSLANMILVLLGQIIICSVLIHLVLVFVHFFDKVSMASPEPQSLIET